jgi:hypothetical protein
MARTHAVLTPAQLLVLVYAEQRIPGQPWTADGAVSEQCCDLGLLEAGAIVGMEPGSPNSTAYDLTTAGQRALDGRGRRA